MILDANYWGIVIFTMGDNIVNNPKRQGLYFAMSLMGYSSKEAGFTLMEVIVATAICAIAIGVAMAGITQNYRATLRAMQIKDFGMAAKIVYYEILPSLDTLNNEYLDGEITGMEDGWRYEIISTPLMMEFEPVASSEDVLGADDAKVPFQNEEDKAQKVIIEDDNMREVTIKVISPSNKALSFFLLR